ncbi:MAG: hypothetical protein NT135_00765 [Candidatus Berkelbacteria bacterium]|nr:hypothetical protein [Candidatus Berkelbacteria bacterium]
MKNTKKSGVLRFLIYKRAQDKLFTGVCLDLDIVEQADNLEKLRKSLEEAAFGYVDAVRKKDLSEKLLNQPAPKKYWKILVEIEGYLHSIHQVEPIKEQIPAIDSQFFVRQIQGPCVAP